MTVSESRKLPNAFTFQLSISRFDSHIPKAPLLYGRRALKQYVIRDYLWFIKNTTI